MRLSLGARQGQLLALVVSRGVRIAFWGIAIGSAGALLAGKALASLVYGVSPYAKAPSRPCRIHHWVTCN